MNEQIFKKGSVTYYYSSQFFTGQVKKDVYTLYAYVRTVDNYVDIKPIDRIGLERTYKDTVQAWKGEVVKEEIVTKFVELAKRKGFLWEWVEAFWQAMKSDLIKTNYKNFSELKPYIYGSAEVVGLMMVKILDLPKDSILAAQCQGRAMQFINFIRDVKEDEELGRNYLGYQISWKTDREKWAKFVRGLIQKYYEIQNEAEKGYRYIPKKYLIPIKTAADLYNWTARKIWNEPGIVWDRKIKPSKIRAIWQMMINVILLK